MRSRLLLVATTVATAMTVLVSASFAVTTPQTFSVLDISDQNVPAIGGFTFERPPVAGDRFEIADTLYRWKGIRRGARIGNVRGIGTFLTGFGPNFQQRATVTFVVQASLPTGTLMIEGNGTINPNGPSRFTLPIIGGTGNYANARGFVTVRDLGTGEADKSNVDVHILP
jgi:Dirigent-like protein